MLKRLLFEFMYLFTNPRWDTGVSPPELLAFLRHNPPGRALDIGCGTGTNVITMAEHGWKVTGIDFSAVAVRRARSKAMKAGCEVSLLRGNALEFDDVSGSFDLILDIGCFHTLPLSAHETYASNFAKLLRPGGTFLLYTWLRSESDEEGDLPTEATIRAVFEPICPHIEIEYGTDKAGERTSAWFTMRRAG
jgi:cyclopropane fatty-acyl-phospholipid synthase-like methyltransferase